MASPGPDPTELWGHPDTPGSAEGDWMQSLPVPVTFQAIPILCCVLQCHSPHIGCPGSCSWQGQGDSQALELHLVFPSRITEHCKLSTRATIYSFFGDAFLSPPKHPRCKSSPSESRGEPGPLGLGPKLQRLYLCFAHYFWGFLIKFSNVT